MKETDDFSKLSAKEKLEAENNLLKMKLHAEFGMKKMESSLDEKAENEWLNYIYEFEKQYSKNKQCKLIDFLGRPGFRKFNEMGKEEISQELERINKIMLSHGVHLDTICEYEDEVIYRFITEELFEHEIDDMRIPGMMHGFIYEEFHPNHDYDLRKLADEFIDCLISKPWNEFMNDIMLASSVIYNDKEYERKAFIPIILAFQSANQKMELPEWKINSVQFNLAKESAEIVGLIKYKSVNSQQVFEGKVHLECTMKHDFWSISKVVLPGFSN